ncbi:hypothetical protein D6D04_06246 [Aureobasidium pullulans]|nr:hypothetical protein D6D04_06246 [Aureobasidium pullulans]
MQLPEHSYPTPVDGDEAECADVDYSIDVHQHDTAKFLSEYPMDRRWHSASSLPPQPDGGVSSFGSYTTQLVWDQLPASTTRIDGYLEDFGFGQRGNVGAFDVHSGPGAREVNGWPRPTSSNDLAFSEYTNPQSAYPGVIPGLLYGSSSGCSPKKVSMYEPVCNNVLMAQHGSAPGDGNNYFSEAELEILEYSTMMTEQQAQHDQVYQHPQQQFLAAESWPRAAIAHGPTGAISAAKAQITTDHNLYQSDKIHLPSSILGHPNHYHNMTSLASSQPQNTGFLSGSSPDVSLARFRSADGAHPTLKRSLGSFDEQSPVSAASPDAPPGKVAIPALPPPKRPRNDSAVNNGPLSKEVKLMARPKPGRKPMNDPDDSQDKRKTQNRVAQRNFRDRRAQKCAELEVANKELDDRYNRDMHVKNEQLMAQGARIAQLEAEKAQSETEKTALALENDKLKVQLQQRELDIAKLQSASSTAQSQRSMLAPSSVSSVHQILTPPSDSYHDELEMDFTNLYSRSKPSVFTVDPEEHCGFCSDVENCICRQQEELNKSLPPIDSSRATSQPKLPIDVSTPSFLEAPTNASGPGTCDMCLADPEKARQCRELAEATGLDEKNKPIGTVTLRRLKDLDTAKHSARTSCSDFFQLAQQKNVKLGPADYKPIKHVYRYQHPDGRPEHSPYMEMDAQDAAHALAALSRQDTRSGMDRHA